MVSFFSQPVETKLGPSYFVRTLLFSPCHFSSFTENTNDPYEKRFNTTQNTGRSTIECGFGRSKNKWRVMIRGSGGMRFMSPLQAGKCIMVSPLIFKIQSTRC